MAKNDNTLTPLSKLVVLLELSYMHLTKNFQLEIDNY